MARTWMRFWSLDINLKVMYVEGQRSIPSRKQHFTKHDNQVLLDPCPFVERSYFMVTNVESDQVNSLKSFFRTAQALIMFGAAARALTVFVRPETQELISSIAEDPQSLSIWIKIPMAGFHFLTTLFTFFTVLGYIGISLWCAAVIESIIRQTR